MLKIVAFVSAATCFVLACGCGSSAVVQPKAPHAEDQQASADSAVIVRYSKYTDPLYLVFDNERTLYSRMLFARLWVHAAKSDLADGSRSDGSGASSTEARVERLDEASRALASAEAALAEVTDACAAGVVGAVSRGSAMKRALERRYLAEVEREGELGVEARVLDVQIHCLRDELEPLRELARLCPIGMYDSVGLDDE